MTNNQIEQVESLNRFQKILTGFKNGVSSKHKERVERCVEYLDPSGMRSTNALCLSIFSFSLGFDEKNSPNVAPQERLVQQPSKALFRDLK
jgi:hypothetical protein